MEKLRSRLAYSIVAELRSTALRRVAHNTAAHHRISAKRVAASKRIDCQAQATATTVDTSRSKSPLNSGVDKPFHSNAGLGMLV